jgi:hypothetical protein
MPSQRPSRYEWIRKQRCSSLAISLALCIHAISSVSPARADTLIDVDASIQQLALDGTVTQTYHSVNSPSVSSDGTRVKFGPDSPTPYGSIAEMIWSVDTGEYYSNGSIDLVDEVSASSFALSVASTATFWVEGIAGTEFSIARNAFGLLQDADTSSLAGTGLQNYDVAMSYLGTDGTAVNLSGSYSGSNASLERFGSHMLAGTYLGVTSNESRTVGGVTYTKALALSERITVAAPVTKNASAPSSYADYSAFTTVSAVPVVPEPSSFVALAGMGLVGLVAVRFRRRRN